MKFRIDELVSAVGGELQPIWNHESPSPDAPRGLEGDTSFSIDTRSLRPGQMFIALQGDNTDGHTYLQQALQQGAGGLLISRLDVLHTLNLEQTPDAAPPVVILVKDTLAALQAIARACRRKHDIPVIGVTGSNGKTTVKDMTASILRELYGEQHVLHSEKSFNNHIGLPLTLANMQEHHRVAVVEMGMNAPGEIRHLAGIAQPQIGTVTNIAPAHIGFFGSIDAIFQAKMELIERLPLNGTAVLNSDDDFYEQMLHVVNQRSWLTFGLEQAHAPIFTAANITISEEAVNSFDLVTPSGRIPITLNIPGHHNISNALAAVASIAAISESHLTHSPEAVKKGLEHFQASPMRMQVIKHHNITIINDAYNANPKSMASALRTLKTLRCQGQKIAVLGDMFELGEHSPTAHYDIGKIAAEVPIDRLFLLGDHAQNMAYGAQDAGMKAEQIVIGDSHQHLADELSRQIHDHDIILVKASRGMTMEKIIGLLIVDC